MKQLEEIKVSYLEPILSNTLGAAVAASSAGILGVALAGAIGGGVGGVTLVVAFLRLTPETLTFFTGAGRTGFAAVAAAGMHAFPVGVAGWSLEQRCARHGRRRDLPEGLTRG